MVYYLPSRFEASMGQEGAIAPPRLDFGAASTLK